MFDKVRVSLFISTLVSIVIIIVLSVLMIGQRQTINNLNAELKSVQSKEKDQKLSADEKLIKDFYMEVYNYKKSQKEISMTTVRELASEQVYKELQNEINVDESYRMQQNTLKQSVVLAKDIQILMYQTKDDVKQYLVTIPVSQVINGNNNQFEINQIVKIKNHQINQRVSIQLGSDSNG